MQEGLRPLGRERVWLTILLVPTFIGLVFGTLGSIVATIILSFMKWDLISPPQFAGLDNYLGLLKDQLFLKSITVTVSFALLYVPGTMIISLLVAVLLNRKLRGTGLFRTVYFLPVVSSAVAVGLVWSWIYAKDAGLLNYFITNLGGEPVNWLSTRNALYSVVIVNIWGAIGEGAIIFLAGLQAVPNDYHEAAQVDGASELAALHEDHAAAVDAQHFLPDHHRHHQCLSGVRVRVRADARRERRVADSDDGLLDLAEWFSLVQHGQRQRAGAGVGGDLDRVDVVLQSTAEAVGGL